MYAGYYEEGDRCPECFEGSLYYPPVENCSCHISPPCAACTNNQLKCDKCGYQPEKPEYKDVPVTPSVYGMTKESIKMPKDWTGNKKTTFVTLGASNHTDHERAEHDYYATEPKAIDFLLEVEKFDGTVWENCCGEGHLSKRMIELGLNVVSTDLIDRGYGEGNKDFFKCTETLGDNIVTNPPYAFAQEWVEHSLKLLHNGKKLALFLPIQFLESDDRKHMFKKTPPVRIHVFSNRILCGINGDFYEHNPDGSIKYKKNGEPKKMSSAKCYAWFVWEVGNYFNKPVVDWIN